MNRLTILGVIGLALLCVLCAFFRAPAIEGEVREAALACAEDVGLDPGVIGVSGRDVILSGYVTSKEISHHLMSCIAAFPGTRSVDNETHRNREHHYTKSPLSAATNRATRLSLAP